MRILLLAVVFCFAAAQARAAAFQYKVPLEYTRKGKARTADAFLWLPPEAEMARGVIMAGSTLMERDFVADARIRDVCRKHQLAIVFLTCGLASVEPQSVLDKLAQRSGYHELRVAPLMFVGHSAGGPQARKRAAQMPQRCFGLLQYRGGLPGGEPPVGPGVPCLAMLGQFDEFWGTMRTEDGTESWERAIQWAADYRKAHAANLLTLLVEPGAGHFAWSERNAVFAAEWLDAAASARIPHTWKRDRDAPVVCKDIDPATGWLTDLKRRAGHLPAAACDSFAGDQNAASWHFNPSLAKASERYHEGLFGRKDQFLRWEDPYWVDAGTRFFFTRITWVEDGATFEVHPVYAETCPKQHKGNGPKWPQAGRPVGNSGVPIQVRRAAGPIKPVGGHRFAMHFDNLAPATGRLRTTFMAYSAGNEEYRHTERVGMLPRGFKGLRRGKKQTIQFPEIADRPADAAPVKLNATSNADLPVRYYVDYGPATIDEGHLRIKGIPARAVFPIELSVVAWQFGRGLEPKVATAQPVTRTFKITAPKDR